MKRFGIGLGLALLIITFLGLSPFRSADAQSPQDFTIESFQADYYLSKDAKNVSTMRVVETIDAVFPNFNQNHGILRAIPKEYKGNNLSIAIQSITNADGVPYKFTTSTDSGNQVLKIGDAATFVQGSKSDITYAWWAH